MPRSTSKIRLSLILVLMLVPGLASAEDLLQVYQQARASDPVLAQADAQRLATQEGISQARAALLPQLSASYNYSSSHGTSSNTRLFNTANGFQIFSFTASDQSYGTILRGTLSQTLFNFSDWANLKAAHAQAKSQNMQYQSAVQDLYLRVARAYFGVLAAQDQLTYAKSNEKALARQFEQAQQRFQVGLAAITDVNKAKAQHDSAVANVITARNNLDDTREALTQITGQPVTHLSALRQDIPLHPPVPAQLSAWVQRALHNNPTLQSYEQKVLASNDTVKAARGAYLPTLSAQLSYTRSPGWGNQSPRLGGLGAYHTNSLSRNTAIGVVLNVPIFTGFATQSRVRQAVYNRDVSKDVLEQNRRGLIRNTRNAYRSVLAGIAGVQANQQTVVSAKSSFDATQAGYEVGTQTIVDVLLAQQALYQAQSAYSQARYNLLINRLSLVYDAGSLDFQSLQQLNDLLQ